VPKARSGRDTTHSATFAARASFCYTLPMDDKPAVTPRARQERQLDEALKETFPASDPVAIGHIDSEAELPTPDQVRQKLARRHLRALIARHEQDARS